MPITDYQAKYLAYELTKRCPSDSVEKLAAAVAGAQVDLNPHQVDAALFAFQSPLSKGAILADEVDLGKTIEAGLVISQKWAEQKRRILIITPSNLRKQWHQEMSEKFFLPCEILESRSYNAAVKQGNYRPFESKTEAIVICSYQFARNKAGDVRTLPGSRQGSSGGVTGTASGSFLRTWVRRVMISRVKLLGLSMSLRRPPSISCGQLKVPRSRRFATTQYPVPSK